MQYIDNDMDDLFKKAGEDYPLRTDGGDWEAMQARLAGAPRDMPLRASKAFRRNYLWYLSVLLIPAFLLLRKETDKKIVKNGTIVSEKSRTAADPLNTNKKSNPDPSGIVLKPSSSTGSASGRTYDIPEKAISPESNDVVSKSSDLNSGGAGEKAAEMNGEERKIAVSVPSTVGEPTAITEAPSRTRKGRPGVQQQLNRESPGITSLNNRNIKSGRNLNKRKNDVASSTDSPNKSGRSGQLEVDRTVASADDESGLNDIPVDSVTALRQPISTDTVSVMKDSSQSNPVTAAPKQTKVKSAATGFYYGLLTGPDFSTVRAQKVKNVGYSVGAVLGYRIDKNWSLETGIWWDKKDYFSTGEYFDKARTGIPPMVKVIWLDGHCGMFEFPVSVRYDLNMKRNAFFGMLGLTSYVMKKEDYTYKGDDNGNYYIGERSYPNSGSRLFSNLQISAGYKYAISDKLSLRIEPYIKLPVQHIGIGRMPISSKGIYFGIIRSVK